MARSARYRALSPRLAELRKHLLPQTFDATQPPTTRQTDRILGYRLLAHAEIEACLEDLVTATVKAAWKGFKHDAKPRTCLLALLAYYSGGFGGPPDTLTPDQASAKALMHLQDRIDHARNHHINQVVHRNNGVQEKNLLAMLLPVGVAEADLDKTWLATIDSFGQLRGSTAHQSRRTQHPPNPLQELQTVRQIVTGMHKLDARLTALRDH